MTVVDSSFGIWDGTTNLVQQGGFEATNALTSWTPLYSTCTLTRDASTFRFGTASMLLTSTGHDGGGTTPVSYIGAYITPPSTPVAGTTYTWSVWVKVASAMTIHLLVQDAPFNWGVYGSDVSVPANTWTRLTATGAPSGTVTSTLTFRVEKASGTWAANEQIWYDGLQWEQLPVATPYVNTNGSTATRTAGKVAFPNDAITGQQGWAAIRVRCDVTANTAGHDLYAFEWGDLGSLLRLYHNGASWIFAIQGGGSQTENTVAASDPFSLGAKRTLVVYWTSSQIGISLNGAAFTTGTRTVGNLSSTSALYVGNRSNSDRALDGDVKWFITGTGTLTNADATTLNNLGDTDPGQTTLGSTAGWRVIWPADTTTYTSSVALTGSTTGGNSYTGGGTVYENIDMETWPPTNWTLSTFFPTGASYAQVVDPLGVENHVALMECDYASSLTTDYTSAALQQAALSVNNKVTQAHGSLGETTYYYNKFMCSSGSVFCNGVSNYMEEHHVQETGPLSCGMFAYGNYPLTSGGTTTPKLMWIVRGGSLLTGPAAQSEIYFGGSTLTGYADTNTCPGLSFPQGVWIESIHRFTWGIDSTTGYFQWWVNVNNGGWTKYADAAVPTWLNTSGQQVGWAVYNYRYNVTGNSLIYYARLKNASTMSALGYSLT